MKTKTNNPYGIIEDKLTTLSSKKFVPTPGPWTARYEEWHGGYVIGTEKKESDPNRMGIAVVPCGVAGHSPNAEANALLIAASPNLLKVAKESITALSSVEEYTLGTREHNFSRLIKTLIEVVAKAEGRGV